MTGWKQMSKGEKIAALQPLFARGLSYREVAAIMGTSSGAVAGFVFTNPSAKPPCVACAPHIADRMTFGDGVAAARIAVRLKSVKPSPPDSPDGGSDRDKPKAPTSPGAGQATAAALERSATAAQGRVRKPASPIPSDPPRNRPTVVRHVPPVASVERIVANRTATNSIEPLPACKVSVALVPSLETPEPMDGAAQPPSRSLAVVPSVAPPAPSGNVSMLQLSGSRCRWPIWGYRVDPPPSDEAAFCGAHIIPGRTYCDQHRALAYNTPKAPPSAGDKSRFRLPKTRSAS